MESSEDPQKVYNLIKKRPFRSNSLRMTGFNQRINPPMEFASFRLSFFLCDPLFDPQ
jgi:hypothetical protein